MYMYEIPPNSNAANNFMTIPQIRGFKLVLESYYKSCSCRRIYEFINSLRKSDKMLDKPSILYIILNSFNKLIQEPSCETQCIQRMIQTCSIRILKYYCPASQE